MGVRAPAPIQATPTMMTMAARVGLEAAHITADLLSGQPAVAELLCFNHCYL
jgi:hypothetical protein